MNSKYPVNFLRFNPFLDHCLKVRFTALYSVFFAIFIFWQFPLAAQIGSGTGSGSGGCDQYTVELCITDECGNPLFLPYEVLSELSIVVNNSTKVPTNVSQQDENGCVTLVYTPLIDGPLYNIRIVWDFQQNSCPPPFEDCTPEEFRFGIDHVLINGPGCIVYTSIVLSNYTWKNKFHVWTDPCNKETLNRLTNTIEVCGNNPALFLEVDDEFQSNYLNNYAEEFIIIDNNNLDLNGNPVELENVFIRCPEGRLQVSQIFEQHEFECGEDEEGNPITETVTGIDLMNYLTREADCEDQAGITVHINLYCCDNGVPATEPFVSTSYSFIWQPDVQVPDPLFYFITENNIIEGFSDGTKYDNGISGDDLLLNADNDVTTYTGDGPQLGTTSGGLGFDGNITNYDCVEKFEIELFEFPSCGIQDWNLANPITVDHDQDPSTPDISRFDITSEVTPNGYDALFNTLAVDPIFGESLIPLKRNTCYYAKVILTTQCEVIERFGRFQTANCNICKEVDLKDERVVKVFPTILDHQLTIGSNIDFPENVDIILYDASGRVSMRTKHQGKGRFIHLNPMNLHSGLHFVQIRFENEKIVHKVFVK